MIDDPDKVIPIMAIPVVLYLCHHIGGHNL